MIDEKEVLKILKRYEGRMNPTAYFGLEADIVNIPTVDAIPIPKGATNGQMIMAMFPESFCYEAPIPNGGVVVIFNGIVEFNEDWWNAPYKEMDKK